METSADEKTLLLLNHTWLAPELRELGHHVFTAGWSHQHFDVVFSRSTSLPDLLQREPLNNKVDAVIYFDDSHAPSVIGIEDVTVPTVLYSVDTHHHFKWHRYFGACFDRVLTAQKDYIGHLTLPDEVRSEAPERVQWLPLWAPTWIEPAQERTINVCFRGNLDASLHPQRTKFFNELQELIPVDVGSGSVAEAYAKARIVVNQCVSGDLNFRVFEGLLSGALLVTPLTSNGLLELFENGTDLVVFERDNVEEAAKYLRYYLEHETERRKIAESGMKKARESHTALKRAAQLLTMIPETKCQWPRRYYGAAHAAVFGLGLLLRAGEEGKSPWEAEHMALLLAAERNIIRSANERELVNDDFRGSVFVVQCYLESIGEGERATALGKLMHEQFPEDLALAVSYIDTLVRSGENTLARVISERVSEKPGELLEHLPRLMAEARAKLSRPAS